MTGIVIRAAVEADFEFLWEMLSEASFPMVESPPSRESIRNDWSIAKYLAGWGRAGDYAVVAEADGNRAGAAWYRLFPRSDPGYGFFDDAVPELSIAVHEAHRGHAIGRSLLEALLEAARKDGFRAVSLSVARANERARRLYERCGFAVVGEHEAEDGVTMSIQL